MPGVATLVAALAVVASSGVVHGQQCSRYGGASCCNNLDPVGIRLADSASLQPFYLKFVPDSEDNRRLDNGCYTFFPLPDSPNTYLLYISHVFRDGSNYINSYVMNEPEAGVRVLGKALCAYTETLFATAVHTNVDPACDIYLYYRCLLRGDCNYDITDDTQVPVMGLSATCRPISRSCLNSVKSTISNNGLPDTDYLILPMKLPTRCVYNQVCSILPTLQRFRQVVGVAFPSLGGQY